MSHFNFRLTRRPTFLLSKCDVLRTRLQAESAGKEDVTPAMIEAANYRRVRHSLVRWRCPANVLLLTITILIMICFHTGYYGYRQRECQVAARVAL